MRLPALAWSALALVASARAAPPPAVEGLSDEVLSTALTAWECAGSDRDLLAVIDWSKPSTERRLWILRPSTGEVLHHEWVAHGQGTGDDRATRFSNEEGTHASSLGVFRTAETYTGKHGYSLRLDGLDPGFNDRARERAIVIHGADYVSESFIDEHGRLGRSWGCPAVRSEVAVELIDVIRGGVVLVAWYPDSRWLEGSPWLRCANGP